MTQDDNLRHGKPGGGLRPAVLVSLRNEDRLGSSGQEETHWREGV